MERPARHRQRLAAYRQAEMDGVVDTLSVHSGRLVRLNVLDL
ncbi:MAG: hypothetical protein AB1938_31215 [Myxococcota bacterium]